MKRVLKVVECLPKVDVMFDGEEEPIIALDADNNNSEEDVSFKISSDPQYPGQWRSDSMFGSFLLPIQAL